MTQIPSGTKFIGIKSTYPTSEKKSALANSYSEIYTIEDIAANSGVGPQGIQGPVGPQGPAGPVGPAGLTWQGAWDTSGSYVEDDAVGYEGASYFCILAVSGSTPPSEDTTHWALLASQGATGATGAQGPMGPQGPAGTSASLPYKSYVAYLSSNPGGPVTATVVYNNLGQSVTWAVGNDDSEYTATSTGIFTLNKTVMFTNTQMYFALINAQKNLDTSNISFILTDINGDPSGTTINNLLVEIRVYN